MKSSASIRAAVLVAVLACARSAAADITPDAADKLFEQGVALFDRADYQGARQAFAAAWSKKQTYDIAGNLGLAELKLERYRDATEHLSYALKHFPETETDARRKALTERFERARARVGALTITVNVDGASIAVDGNAIDPTSGDTFVDAGDHALSARKAGFTTCTVRVHVDAGSAQPVSCVLQPEAPAVTPSSNRTVWLGVGFGAAAVGLGAGILFTALSNGKSSDRAAALGALAKQDPSASPSQLCAAGSPNTSACANVRDLAGSQGTFKGAAIAGYAIGGAALLGTAAYLLLGPRAAAPTPTAMTVDADGHHARFTYSVSF